MWCVNIQRDVWGEAHHSDCGPARQRYRANTWHRSEDTGIPGQPSRHPMELRSSLTIAPIRCHDCFLFLLEQAGGFEDATKMVWVRGEFGGERSRPAPLKNKLVLGLHSIQRHELGRGIAGAAGVPVFVQGVEHTAITGRDSLDQVPRRCAVKAPGRVPVLYRILAP